MTKNTKGHKQLTQYLKIKWQPAKAVSATFDWHLAILILIISILVFASQFLAK